MARLHKKADDVRPVTPEHELLGKGLYTISEAGRVLSFALGDAHPWGKLRRWTFGYKYTKKDVPRESEPIVKPQVRFTENIDVVTFLELVELLVLAALRKKGLSIKTIRRIQEAALRRYGGPYPFARREYHLLGREVFADLGLDDVGTLARDRKFSEEVLNGQLAFDEIVRPLFEKCMDYDSTSSMAQRFWPLGHGHSVVMDPKRSFGKPINSESGVPTAVLFSLVAAGDSEEDVAAWYELAVSDVHEAVVFETGLRENKAA